MDNNEQPANCNKCDHDPINDNRDCPVCEAMRETVWERYKEAVRTGKIKPPTRKEDKAND